MRVIISILFMFVPCAAFCDDLLYAPSTTGKGELAVWGVAPYKRDLQFRFGQPLKFEATRVKIWEESDPDTGKTLMWSIGAAGYYKGEHDSNIGPLLKTKRFAYWAGNRGSFDATEKFMKGVGQLRVLPGESYMIFQVYTKDEAESVRRIVVSFLKKEAQNKAEEPTPNPPSD